jgi:uncharacterized membrane protein (DUF373 family)
MGGAHMKPSKMAYYIHSAESIILAVLALVLIVLAVVLLGNSVIMLWKDIANGTLADTGIEILNSVLLVMMIMEIVYTVAMSLESHTLVAEPFLIIGAIAAIRRMLVITAESTKLESNPAAFRSLLLELGLLGFLVIAMAASIFILRRSAGARMKEQESGKLDSKSKV